VVCTSIRRTGLPAQLALKLMSPGVPDFYQGTELWDFSLLVIVVPRLVGGSPIGADLRYL
jgi:hypothetical protein